MDASARSVPNQKRTLPSLDTELVELLWHNGGVVGQAQTRQRSSGRGQSGVACEATAVWLPDGDGRALDRDLYSQLWHSIANAERDREAFVRPPEKGGAGSSWTGEVVSSFCSSSSQMTALPMNNDIDDAALPSDEQGLPCAGASSSGGSGRNAFKRGRDEFDSRSEDADCEAIAETRSLRRPAAKRRSRAAEVHNLSERRRRDRINEKMRALQELVPHCNKTDKASILDEAIEYLKSLQLQVQIMLMTTGMAPMMFPGAHQLMSPMAVGLSSACMPSAQSLSQLQRVPPYLNHRLPNQMPQSPPSAVNAPNVANESSNCFLLPNDMQTAAPQVPGLFAYGSQMVQQNQIPEVLASTVMPTSRPGPLSSSDGT